MKWVYGATVFLGAWLLMVVQPLLGRSVLPFFGGTAAVWCGVMMFFQVMVLGGYALSFLLSRGLGRRGQVCGAGGVLGLAVWGVWSQGILPRTDAGLGTAAGAPWVELLGFLGGHALWPALALATTAPMLQHWRAGVDGGRVWRLQSVSNAGSLGALAAFPLALEPWLGAAEMEAGWRWLFLLWVAGWLACAAVWWRGGAADVPEVAGERSGVSGAAGAWRVGLCAALGSALLQCLTLHLTTDLAGVPLLWTLPLGLYLVSFILAFAEAPGGGRRRWELAPALVCVLLYNIPGWTAASPWTLWSLGVTLGAVFFCCWVCHGEMARLRPGGAADGGLSLTGFYLAVAAGGAAGGVGASLLAPLIFKSLGEQMWIFWGFLVLWWLAAGRRADGASRSMRVRAWLAVAALFTGMLLPWKSPDFLTVHVARNFYGVVKIKESDGMRYLVHGTTLHGCQFLDEGRRRQATAYFGPRSGVALALQAAQARWPGPLRVGVVGLGAGTMAAWGRAGDEFDFFELDPAVVEAAEKWFTFVSDSPAKVRILRGDGRRELAVAGNAGRRYHVLFLDAFSSDAIPVHLLTREALAIYAGCLEEGGVLVFNITNRRLDLEPLLAGQAGAMGWQAWSMESPADDAAGWRAARYLAMGPRLGVGESAVPGALCLPAEGGWRPARENGRLRLWTDDYSSLWLVLK